MPSEELNYRLDNVLPLTAPYRILVYNNLIKFECDTPNPSNPGNCEKIERKITHFSTNSRRKLSKHLCRIRFDQYKHRLFCTFTFHDVWPKNQTGLKNILDKFSKRLNRLYDEVAFVWKLEYQKRGAPHMHYFVLIKKYMGYKERQNFARDIKKAWTESVGDTDREFIQMSVDIREVANNHKTANYLTKYIAKVDGLVPEHHFGRFWAISNNLNENPLIVLPVTEDFYFNAKNRFLGFLKQKYKLDENQYDRIAMNNSFEIQSWHRDSMLTLLIIARLQHLTYIRDFIQSSPQIPDEISPQHPARASDC